MIAIQTRKQALLLESNLNRLQLRAELNNLRESTGFLKKMRRYGTWASLLVPVAGVVVTLILKRSTMAGGLLRVVLAGAPEWIRLWRSFRRILSELK